jgi:hypothetical protein
MSDLSSHAQGFQRSRVGGFSFWVKVPALQQQRQGSTMSTLTAASERTPHGLRRITSEKLADGSDDTAFGVEDQPAAIAAGSGSQKGSSGNRDAGSEKRPLVFLHGVGWGLVRLACCVGYNIVSSVLTRSLDVLGLPDRVLLPLQRWLQKLCASWMLRCIAHDSLG